MRVDHICVNFGAPLFNELLIAINEHNIKQNVFYPRNNRHRIIVPNNLYQVDSPRILNLLTKLSFSYKRYIMRQWYEPLFLRNKPDIIHAHTLFSDGSLADYFYRKFGTPYIVAIRSTDIDQFLRYKFWLKGYGKQILDNANRIVFITPALRKKFVHIYGEVYESKSVVIPNGIHESFVMPGIEINGNLHSPVEILYVGSFLRRKNVPALIRLVEQSGTRLTIVGNGGNGEKKVLRMIRNSKNINYLGRIEELSHLIQVYRQSDIFIMTSKNETFGMVYIEAMSQGLPVVYSRNTGIDGLWEQGSIGYGVTPGSVTEMKIAIEKIAADYPSMSSRCMAEAGQMTWPDIAGRYAEMYNGISNE